MQTPLNKSDNIPWMCRSLLGIQSVSRFWAGLILTTLSRFCMAMTLKAKGCGEVWLHVSPSLESRVREEARLLPKISGVLKIYAPCFLRIEPVAQSIKLPTAACRPFPKLWPFPANIPACSSTALREKMSQPCNFYSQSS